MAFVLLATLRSFEFQDTTAYKDFFVSQIGVGLFAPKQTQFEWGFVFLTRLCTILSGDYRVLFFVQAAIINLIAVSILSKSESKLLLYACFMSFYGMYTTFIIMRAGLAIAFFALGVMRFDKNWPMRLVCFAVSVLFHMSAAVMIVVYLFAYLIRKINIRAEYACITFILLLILFASGVSKDLLIWIRQILMCLNNRPLFIQKAINYITYYVNIVEFSGSTRYLFNTIIFLLAVFTITKYKIKLSPTLRANLVFIFFGLCLESMFGQKMFIVRITDFTNILNLCSIGIIVNNNLSKMKSFDIIGVNGTPDIGKIRTRQWYNFILGEIVVCANIIFLYRIVFVYAI